MRILNVIEMIGPYGVTVHSFPIPDEYKDGSEEHQQTVKDAENKFLELASANGFEDDHESLLDEGVFGGGLYKVFLIWSEPVKLIK